MISEEELWADRENVAQNLVKNLRLYGSLQPYGFTARPTHGTGETLQPMSKANYLRAAAYLTPKSSKNPHYISENEATFLGLTVPSGKRALYLEKWHGNAQDGYHAELVPYYNLNDLQGSHPRVDGLRQMSDPPSLQPEDFTAMGEFLGENISWPSDTTLQDIFNKLEKKALDAGESHLSAELFAELSMQQFHMNIQRGGEELPLCTEEEISQLEENPRELYTAINAACSFLTKYEKEREEAKKAEAELDDATKEKLERQKTWEQRLLEQSAETIAADSHNSLALQDQEALGTLYFKETTDEAVKENIAALFTACSMPHVAQALKAGDPELAWDNIAFANAPDIGLDSPVRDWCHLIAPNDTLVDELPDRTFREFWDAMQDGKDVYPLMGDAQDSFLRENIFQGLSLATHQSYDAIYSRWTSNTEGKRELIEKTYKDVLSKAWRDRLVEKDDPKIPALAASVPNGLGQDDLLALLDIQSSIDSYDPKRENIPKFLDACGYRTLAQAIRDARYKTDPKDLNIPKKTFPLAPAVPIAPTLNTSICDYCQSCNPDDTVADDLPAMTMREFLRRMSEGESSESLLGWQEVHATDRDKKRIRQELYEGIRQATMQTAKQAPKEMHVPAIVPSMLHLVDSSDAGPQDTFRKAVEHVLQADAADKTPFKDLIVHFNWSEANLKDFSGETYPDDKNLVLTGEKAYEFLTQLNAADKDCFKQNRGYEKTSISLQYGDLIYNGGDRFRIDLGDLELGNQKTIADVLFFRTTKTARYELSLPDAELAKTMHYLRLSDSSIQKEPIKQEDLAKERADCQAYVEEARNLFESFRKEETAYLADHPEITAIHQKDAEPFLYICDKANLDAVKPKILYQVAPEDVPAYHLMPTGHDFQHQLNSLSQGDKDPISEPVRTDIPETSIVFASTWEPKQMGAGSPALSLVPDKDYQAMESLSHLSVMIYAKPWKDSPDFCDNVAESMYSTVKGIHAVGRLLKEKEESTNSYIESCKEGIATYPKDSWRQLTLWYDDTCLQECTYTYGKPTLSETAFLTKENEKPLRKAIQLFRKYDREQFGVEISDLDAYRPQDRAYGELPKFPTVEESYAKWEENCKRDKPYGSIYDGRPEPDYLGTRTKGDYDYLRDCNSAFSDYADIQPRGSEKEHYQAMIQRLADTGRSVAQIKAIGQFDKKIGEYVQVPSIANYVKKAHARYLEQQK